MVGRQSKGAAAASGAGSSIQRRADGRWYTSSMPIYEFVCQDCESAFEELVCGKAMVVCPACGSNDVRRALSRFAVHSSSPGLGGRGGKSCSSCSSSSCAGCH